jgi:uncharacterized membrane protein (UPF0136 family)
VKARLSLPLIILMFLSLEKFVQHMVVTYAFMMDLGGIRQFVTYDYRIFMFTGFVIGVLFLLSFVLMARRATFGLNLLFVLALFDFVTEFIAQGTLNIVVTVSILAASAIIIVYLMTKKSLIEES